MNPKFLTYEHVLLPLAPGPLPGTGRRTALLKIATLSPAPATAELASHLVPSPRGRLPSFGLASVPAL